MSRVVALSLTLLLAGQAFASGASRMVCRFTGKTVELREGGCPCGPRESTSTVQRQSCCELRGSLPFTVTAIEKSKTVLPVVTLEAVAHSRATAACRSASMIRWSADPDSIRRPTPLFISLRQLLI